MVFYRREEEMQRDSLRSLIFTAENGRCGGIHFVHFFTAEVFYRREEEMQRDSLRSFFYCGGFLPQRRRDAEGFTSFIVFSPRRTGDAEGFTSFINFYRREEEMRRDSLRSFFYCREISFSDKFKITNCMQFT